MNTRRLAIATALAALGPALPGSAAAAPPPPPPDPTCSPGPADCSQWHTAAVVTVTWAQAPPGVNKDGCETKAITADTAAQPVSCTWWNADGSKSNSVNVRRDATPPSVTARPDRGPDSNGWYNHALTVGFAGGDSMSGVASCSADRTYNAPDSGSATVAGSCTDVAGNTSSAAFPFKYDATSPSVEARPDRKPNKKGWYNRTVRVEFVGSDATSGIGSCAPPVTYQGPDARTAAVSGTCTDKAANTSSKADYELRYDTREPALKRLRRAVLRGGGILLRWSSKDASEFVVVRRPGLKGARPSTLYSGQEHGLVDRRVTEGVKYRYAVTAYDAAGNATKKELSVLSKATSKGSAGVREETAARPALTRPAQGARVAAPPVLDWTAVPRATYYNVQLFRDGKKILTAWPTSTSLRLHRSWKFDGRKQRLEPGRYRWYVWPGYGKRSANDYGKQLGTRTFVVTGT